MIVFASFLAVVSFLRQFSLLVNCIQFLTDVVVVFEPVNDTIDPCFSFFDKYVVFLLRSERVHFLGGMEQVAKFHFNYFVFRLVNA